MILWQKQDFLVRIRTESESLTFHSRADNTNDSSNRWIAINLATKVKHEFQLKYH